MQSLYIYEIKFNYILDIMKEPFSKNIMIEEICQLLLTSKEL
jgi:hypothetical protein